MSSFSPMLGSLMDLYPSKKRTFLQVPVLASIIGVLLVYNANPIEVTQQTLEVTSCKSPDLTLKLNGAPDPCLEQKLHTLYNRTIPCQLVCSSNLNLPATFNGLSAKMDNKDQLIIGLTGITQQHCDQLGNKEKCLIKFDNHKDLNTVLNAVDDEKKGEAIWTSNYWIIFLSCVIAGICQYSVAVLQGKHL